MYLCLYNVHLDFLYSFKFCHNFIIKGKKIQMRSWYFLFMDIFIMSNVSISRKLMYLSLQVFFFFQMWFLRLMGFIDFLEIFDRFLKLFFNKFYFWIYFVVSDSLTCWLIQRSKELSFLRDKTVVIFICKKKYFECPSESNVVEVSGTLQFVILNCD